MESKDTTDDIVIIDETEPCPYLKGETARMPLRMSVEKISPETADIKLQLGYRRTSIYLYDTQCPNCQACEAIRIDCQEFEFSRNQKRILRRCDARYRQSMQDLMADEARVELFNRHRRERGLADEDADIDLDGYTWGFVRSCFESFEISYWREDQLACVAICDFGATSLSAVYTYYDPDITKDSLGTYSILKQIQFCRENAIRFLYLGYYVADSPHMNYKTRFLPHERLLNGTWTRFDSVDCEG